MKKTRFLWVAALIAALVAMLAACPADEGLSLPGKAGDVSAVKSFDDAGLRAPENEDEAFSLLESTFDTWSGSLQVLQGKAFDTAFKKKYDKTFNEWLKANKGQTKLSASVKLTEADNVFTGQGSMKNDSDGWDSFDFTDFEGVKITGSSDASWSSNLTYEAYDKAYPYKTDGYYRRVVKDPKIGDTWTIKTSYKRTADFRNTKLRLNIWDYTNIFWYGIITREEKISEKTTVKAISNDTVNYKADTSGSSTQKCSAVLSISDGNITAKYKLSYANEYSGKERKANSSSETIYSNIEVYDSNNKLLFTIIDKTLYQWWNTALDVGIDWNTSLED